MRSSRLHRIGLFSVLIMVAVSGVGCSYYNQVRSRMSLVDGAQAYNERKFDEAIEKFSTAVEFDPDGNSLESRTAQLFLARTHHSLYVSNRRDSEKAEVAIDEYQKALPFFARAIETSKAALEAKPDDEKIKGELAGHEKNLNSIISAVGSLYENLQQDDKWTEWQKSASENAAYPDAVRANSFVALASKKYACANEITDTEAVKKTVGTGTNATFKFVKPSDAEEFSKLTTCVEEGSTYIDKAVELNDKSDSAWSYKASLLAQNMRIAEMNGESAKQAQYKKESEEARSKFEVLAKEKRDKEDEEARKKAEKAGGEVKDGKDAAKTDDKKADSEDKK